MSARQDVLCIHPDDDMLVALNDLAVGAVVYCHQEPYRISSLVQRKHKFARRAFAGSRRGGGWNWVGVVSGLLNPNDSGVGALEWRPRHDEGYHEGGGCRRRGFAFR